MSQRTGEPTRESVFAPPHRALTVGVVLSVGTVAFESLGVATVLPEVARRLDGLGAYGWGLSALMLANILGTVLAGRAADRGGARRPMAVGLLTFAAGCALAGAATSWPLFLLGRFVQGLGVGAIMAMAYTAIGLTYPEHLRPRMYALLSSAWTVPSLVGPVLAGTLADHTSWRAVFLLIPPLVAVAALLVLPALPGGSGAPASRERGPLVAAVALTLGTALFLQALLLDELLPLTLLAAAGLAVAIPALRRVTPEGTLTARRGIGSGIVIRALLCAVYFGSETYLPLGLQEVRGLSVTEASLGLSVGAISWVAGAALQARRDGTGTTRARDVALGFGGLLAGVLLIGVAMLSDAVPAHLATLGWAIGGLGMGMAFNASTTDTLEQALDRQGEVSAALQLAQTLATAVLAGLGGAAVAFAGEGTDETRAALLATFALTAVLATLGTTLAGRLRPRP
ncbi:MFS transporter [Streptomyces sp. 8K308]|uniref:MFS transporter n=1 Tax=Streptomyces sp. 8K308 TaxID=2530388 RepID=UPI001051F564|nr:MFS transporter [Streptomyces sp. 8K308]TDC22981.1 MFS transporter [Streptomyces sp. 8K308]